MRRDRIDAGGEVTASDVGRDVGETACRHYSVVAGVQSDVGEAGCRSGASVSDRRGDVEDTLSRNCHGVLAARKGDVEPSANSARQSLRGGSIFADRNGSVEHAY